ncbi:MAG: hypothetical protein PHN84_14760 [Desulfuromonadaceae bacterium]|nr:hypothetical protein [Desulfuromonadaceae bacterium]
MLVILFSGYILTTGLAIIDSEIFKITARIMALAFGILSICVKKRIHATSGVAILLGCIFFFINQSEFAINLSFIFFLILATNHLKARHLALIVFFSTLCGVLLHIVTLGLGVISVFSYDAGTRTRFTLGFKNPNTFALVYLSLAITAAYLHLQYRTKWTRASFFVALLCSFPAIYLSDSRTTLLALILFLLWITLLRSRLFIKPTIFAGRIMPYVGIALTIAVIFNNNYTYNELLSYRPAFFSDFIWAPDWLEYIVGWQDSTNSTVDNAYLLLLSALGMPFFLVAIFIFSKRMKRVDPIVIPIISTLLIASVFESFLVRPEIPLALVVFWSLFSRRFPRLQV